MKRTINYLLSVFVILLCNLATYAQIERCGTPEPSQTVSANQLYKISSDIVIPVFFHIVYANIDYVSDSQIQNQIDVLNSAFSDNGTKYSFYNAGITRTQNANWQNFSRGSQVEIDMTNGLANDPEHSLNIYITDIVPLGWVINWPWDVAEDSPQNGVIVDYGSLPGGYISGYNEGKTAVHEVGHYLGLYHTFQNGCQSPGDEVDDTPYHTVNYGCPSENTNTCSQAGNDPVHNYLNYTSDPCMNDFTSGQGGRMDAIVGEYKPSLGIVVGIEDYIWINLIVTNFNVDQTYVGTNSAVFIDTEPYGDYIVEWGPWKIEASHSNGEIQVFETQNSSYIHIPPLPGGYLWERDASGNVLAIISTSGIDNHGYNHYNSVPIKIVNVPYTLVTSGTLASNTNWAGSVMVIGDVTVPSGITLTIQPNTVVAFQNNSSLIVNGSLNATSCELNGGVNTWGSIIFDGSSASGSILNNIVMKNGTEIQCLNGANVTIQNSTLDHNIQGIYVYNSAPQIIDNQIIEPRDNGIHGEAPGLNVTVQDNTITKTQADSWSNYHNFEGIRFTNNTSANVVHNDISGFFWGGYFGGGAIVNFTTTLGNTNNRIIDNLFGLASGWGSTVTAGMRNQIGGYNSIYNNLNFDVYSYIESNLFARYNYWGGGQPISYVDGTSTLNIANVLTTDPWEGGGGGASANINDIELSLSTSSANTNVITKIITSNKNDLDDIEIGIALESQGKINEAVNHYKKMIKDDINVNYAFTKLVNFKHKYSTKGILNYLKSLSNNSKHSALTKKLIADIDLQENRFDDAINGYNSVISKHSNDFQGINSRFEKMFAYLNIKKDKTKANQILSEIKSMNLTDDIWDMRIKTAEHLLGIPDTNNNENIPLQKNITNVESNPDEYILFKNYPNPFNPSTTINYQLPKDGFVTLIIYDILGREVKTLVNEFKSQGRYSVNFNASNLASGVYIYRIKVNDFSTSKKLLLMK